MLRRARIEASEPEPLDGAVLGRRLRGEAALPMQGAKVVWPFAQMLRHAVILGASGTGKTETSMRIAAELARIKGVQIFYLDAKGDRGSAQRFTSLMAASGVETKVFPNQPFNSWKGDWRAIYRIHQGDVIVDRVGNRRDVYR